MAFENITTPVSLPLLIAFIDLAGYRRFAERTSDLDQFGLVDELAKRISHKAEECGGRLLKMMGDSALVVFPEEMLESGVTSLLALRSELDAWLQAQGTGLRIRMKMHFGNAVMGRLCAENALDIIGRAVNQAATFPPYDLSVTAEVFQKLSSGTRTSFQEQSQPSYYVGVDSRARD